MVPFIHTNMKHIFGKLHEKNLQKFFRYPMRYSPQTSFAKLTSHVRKCRFSWLQDIILKAITSVSVGIHWAIKRINYVKMFWIDRNLIPKEINLKNFEALSILTPLKQHKTIKRIHFSSLCHFLQLLITIVNYINESIVAAFIL